MKNGLPGLRGTDHLGFTVPNLNEAIDFFCDVIGCELVYRMGPFRDGKGNFMRDQLNVHPRACIVSQAFLRCSNNLNFELFEYASPDQEQSIPKNSDIGGHHLAFYVDDMEAAVRYLLKHGVRLLGQPVVEREGLEHGATWLYFLAPWGLQLELITYPSGKAYEATTKARLWDPRSF